MKPVVVRNIKRADPNAVGILGGLGVSTTHEAQGRVGLMKPYMRPIWPGAEIAGTAVTVLAQPGDNWMIHVAVEQCRKAVMNLERVGDVREFTRAIAGRRFDTVGIRF